MPASQELPPKPSERLAIKLGTITSDPEIPQEAKDFLEKVVIPAYFDGQLLTREQAEKLLASPDGLNGSNGSETNGASKNGLRLVIREGKPL